jgi:hypothetical protein
MDARIFLEVASKPHQWCLHYFAIILNCDTQVLHSLYIVCFQQLRFRNENGRIQLYAEIQRQITALFSPGRWVYFEENNSSTFEGTRWLSSQIDSESCSVSLWDEDLHAAHTLLVIEWKESSLQLLLHDGKRLLRKWHLPMLLTMAMEKQNNHDGAVAQKI